MRHQPATRHPTRQPDRLTVLTLTVVVNTRQRLELESASGPTASDTEFGEALIQRLVDADLISAGTARLAAEALR